MQGRVGRALPRAPGFAMFRRMGATISITVNGEVREIPGPATVADLLARIGLDLRKVAVERNLEIVPRSTYAATPLSAGDQLEIVHFIGGG
ncbi:MAG TPA: sulfur carrier protein ThiS [Geminicoccaceae bacterium]